MTVRVAVSPGLLKVRVEESSPGLYFWTVTQLSVQAQAGEVCIDTSDHPYSSREAALRMGTACLTAYSTAAEGLRSPAPGASGRALVLTPGQSGPHTAAAPALA